MMESQTEAILGQEVVFTWGTMYLVTQLAKASMTVEPVNKVRLPVCQESCLIFLFKPVVTHSPFKAHLLLHLKSKMHS